MLVIFRRVEIWLILEGNDFLPQGFKILLKDVFGSFVAAFTVHEEISLFFIFICW